MFAWNFGHMAMGHKIPSAKMLHLWYEFEVFIITARQNKNAHDEAD